MSELGEQLVANERLRTQLFAEARQAAMETIGRLSLAAPISVARIDLPGLRARIERLAALATEMQDNLDERDRLTLAAGMEGR